MVELFSIFVVLAAVVVLAPAVLLLGGVALSSLLCDEHPERYLSDPASRRRALIRR